MIVEFGRSCYVSEWHLFKDDSGRTVRGRYYFAPPGTAHYPGLHNLGSRDFNDKNWETVQALGEDLRVARTWNAGQLPAAPPLPIAVGNADQLANGSTAAQTLPITDLIDGFNPECMGPEERLPIWREASSYARCVTQRLYATMIGMLYEDDETGIADLWQDWLGLPCTVRRQSGNLPAVVTVITPSFAVVVVDGTRTFQQLATQAFESISGPTNFGSYGTLPLWYRASTYVLELLAADGMVDGCPVFAVGHSYGAATCHNLLARLRLGSSTRFLRYLTFGAPKPGDARMIDLIRRCAGYDLRNAGDIVTNLCPDIALINPVAHVIGLPSLYRYTLWQRPPHAQLLDENGVLTPRAESILDTQFLQTMVERVIDGRPLSLIREHPIDTYRARLSVHCPGVEWPVNDDVVEDVDNYAPMPFGSIQLGTHRAMPRGALTLAAKGIELPTGNITLSFRPPIPVGQTCETAFPDVVNHVRVFTVDTVHALWVKVPILVAGAYRAHFNLLAGTYFDGVLWTGDCTHLNFEHAVNINPQTIDFFTASGRFAIWEFVPDARGAATISFWIESL